MKHVCISHAPLRFTPTVPFAFYSPMPIVDVDTVVISDDSLGPDFDGRVLSEYLQLFALADSWRDSAELINLFQYRRFLTPLPPPPGLPQKNGGARCSPAQAAALFPPSSAFDSVDRPVIGPVLKVDIAAQYAANHPIEDLRNFTRSMAQSGVFSRAEAAQFLAATHFLVSPSIGIYPARMLVLHLDLMRQVWQHFRAHYFIPRGGYQRRVGGYLMERLQSFLVLATLRLNPGLKVDHWHRIVIEDAAPSPLAQPSASST
jgi:hypothetical protein